MPSPLPSLALLIFLLGGKAQHSIEAQYPGLPGSHVLEAFRLFFKKEL